MARYTELQQLVGQDIKIRMFEYVSGYATDQPSEHYNQGKLVAVPFFQDSGPLVVLDMGRDLNGNPAPAAFGLWEVHSWELV